MCAGSTVAASSEKECVQLCRGIRVNACAEGSIDFQFFGSTTSVLRIESLPDASLYFSTR
jgi:hypothetical protein